MKKEKKRYILAEYVRYITRVCNSREEYNKLLDKINKFNSNSKNNRIFGNISYVMQNGQYNVFIDEYSKLTPKIGITDIDNITSEFNNEEELKKKYSNILYNNKDSYIKVIYLQDKSRKDKTHNDVDREIRSIDVLYKEDIKYFSFNYLRECVKYYIDTNDYGFFLDMANAFEANKCNQDVIFNLRTVVNEYKNFNKPLDNRVLCLFDKLYKSHILERNKDGIVLRDEKGREEVSRRRQRDLSFFVRNYNSKTKTNHIEYNILEEDDYDDVYEEEKALDAWDQGLTYRRK